jgi:hypothetical protein
MRENRHEQERKRKKKKKKRDRKEAEKKKSKEPDFPTCLYSCCLSVCLTLERLLERGAGLGLQQAGIQLSADGRIGGKRSGGNQERRGRRSRG